MFDASTYYLVKTQCDKCNKKILVQIACPPEHRAVVQKAKIASCCAECLSIPKWLDEQDPYWTEGLEAWKAAP